MVFVSSLPHPLLSTVYQCDGYLSPRQHGGSWLGCQVLPAISAVSILELATNNGSSRMSQVHNLHKATQLLNINNNNYCLTVSVFTCFLSSSTSSLAFCNGSVNLLFSAMISFSCFSILSSFFFISSTCSYKM